MLTVKLQLGLPYRKVWINWFSLWDKIYSLIFLILFKRFCLGMWKLGQWREKCVIVSAFLPQSHNGFRVPRNQCLSLRSWRWLRPKNNFVRSLIPYELWISKILFARGIIKLRKFISKIIFPIKFAPFRYSRRKEWVLELIVSSMNCRIIIAMSGCMNSIQVKNQMEQIWWRLYF